MKLDEKIAQKTVGILGGSYIILGLLVLVVFGISSVSDEGINHFRNPFVIKVYAIAFLYLCSIVLLGTLPNKSRKRRFWSWLFSISFHAGLLFYLGVVQEFGGMILLVGFAETLVLLLSIVGMTAFVLRR